MAALCNYRLQTDVITNSYICAALLLLLLRAVNHVYVGQAAVSADDELMTYTSQHDVTSAAVTRIICWRQHHCLLQRPQYNNR